MIRKQRLALAISAALSIAGGAGCSTITGIKATPASTDGNVVVHYVSFSGSRQYLQSELVDSSRTKDLIKSIQLDTEIDVLAEKLGLGKFFENKPKIQKKAPARIQKRIRPQIKRATYNNKKIQQRKVVMRKALATRRKISIANRQLVVTRQVAKRDFSKSTNLITLEREVNRLYLGKKSGRNVQQISRNSLWTRITRGYRLSSDNEQRVVQKILSRHAGNPDNLNRIFEHSGKYLHFIFYELKKRGMPTELALLPMVESTYNNDFKSKSGAVGLWQFRANEGRQLGLRQTSVYDARLDVYASTHAALNKLQSLNHRFKGDWVLTLAAYKEGVKKVQREMIRNRYLGKPVNFWDLNLSKQTQYYVAELLAYREILLRPHAYNLTLPVATTSPKIMQIVVNKVVNLRRASLAANLPVSMLEELNR
ncbi:MAG: transglycosylase SLT domain-containing protein, partial [Cocleimonas sp.]|nr:transglycosylase SLT domain-containing protein [Cocleimonas sp.]